MSAKPAGADQGTDHPDAVEPSTYRSQTGPDNQDQETRTQQAVLDIPQIDVDPYSDAMLEDPYAMHETLREAGPVVHLQKYDMFVVARHADVQAVLNDWTNDISSAGVGLANFRHETPFRPKSLLLEADPPEHTTVRTVISRVLSPKTVQQLRGTFQAEADAMVDRLLAQGEIDGYKELAEYFPLKVFPDAVGLDPLGRENLLLYGDMLFNALGPRNGLLERSMERLKPVSSSIMEHCAREALRPDAPGAQIYQGLDTGEITAEQAPMLVRSFLSAGVDTTVSNRDPRKWPEPDRFNIDRNPIGHMVFGSGIHGCVGQVIARMEGETVLRALAQRVKGIELAGPYTRRRNNSLRAMARMPMRLIPA